MRKSRQNNPRYFRRFFVGLSAHFDRFDPLFLSSAGRKCVGRRGGKGVLLFMVFCLYGCFVYFCISTFY